MTESSIRILSIDDDQGCRRIIERFFALTEKYLVEVAENGREGLKKAAEFRPDIILLDLCMPEMDGAEVLDALWTDAATRDIPVIIVTGACPDDVDYGRLITRPNFALLVQKPVNLQELLKTIKNILQPRAMRTEDQHSCSENSPKPA